MRTQRDKLSEGLRWSLLTLLLGILLTGCGGRVPEIPPQVTDLTATLGEYLADYRANYAVHPRRGSTPLTIAEAYLREYQPGPLPRVFQTTVLYDRNGVKLAEIVEEGYRTWVPLSRISPNLINALLATEDASFYVNPGYDARRVMGAIMQNAEAGEVISGASTVTMQLARQLFFTPEERFEQSMDRKVFETLLSQDLTLTYTKNEILEMYLNLAYFGRTAYGIEAAANLYFGKSAVDLNIAEATLLAGIPQQPADYDPFTNMDAVKERQGVVLSLMVRHEYLTQAEADEVFATPIVLNPNTARPPLYAPHFVQYTINELNRLMPGQDVRRSGMRIFTTLDLKMQSLAERIVLEQVETLRPLYDLSNASLVALKPGTAEILTMVGSADFYNSQIAGQVNVAVSPRQPGSAIKPILYALAMNDLQISPASVIWDVEARYDFEGGESYSPKNYDLTFHGPVTARAALANSYNVPAVKLLDAVGVARMLEGARAMGLNSLTRDTSWYGLSLTLGGGEVTLLDLTTSFHTIANGGRYESPRAILYTTGAPDGRNVTGVRPEPVQVISPESAYLVTHILSDNEAREPAFGVNNPLRLSQPAAAKTGTTSDFRDNWTEGFTRYLVTGVWAGNSDGRPMRNVSGVTGAAPIWSAFMEAVLADPELLALLEAPADPAAWEFIPPAGIVEQQIACPTGITCRQNEVFDQKWLQRTGRDGALADSAIVASMNMVYVDRGHGMAPVGACSAESGVTRQLLRLPLGLTRALPELKTIQIFENGTDAALVALPSFNGTRRNPVMPTDFTEDATESSTAESVVNSTINVTVDSTEKKLSAAEETIARRIREEQRAALAWSSSRNSALYFGACDQIETTVRNVFGDSVRRINVVSGGLAEEAVDARLVEEEEEELPAPEPAVSPDVVHQDTAAPSSYYGSAGVAHDTSCGGDFVLGSVYNASGELIQSVAVVYSDDLGNRNYAAAVNGAYRFPVASVETSHNIYLTLVDATGVSVSDSVTVPHRQGGASDLGCHYVIWQGVN
jgi:penicillin-binding protein 1C